MSATTTAPISRATEATVADPPPPRGGRRRIQNETSLAGRVLANVFLWGYALVAIGPLLLMVSNSLRTQQQIATEPLGLPLQASFINFENAWLTASFETYFVNSIVVTVASVIVTTVVSVLASYAFARARARFFRGIEMVFLSGLMLPVHLAILPLFYLLDQLNMTSNIFSLILVYGALGIPFTTFVLTVFFRRLPIEVEEAALIDGASPLRTFVQILLPLVRPALATVIVFRFVPVWNDFFYPLILLRDRDSYTIPVGLTRFFGEYSTDWPQLFAGLTIATVPLVALFLIATKQIISGLTSGMSK